MLTGLLLLTALSTLASSFTLSSSLRPLRFSSSALALEKSSPLHSSSSSPPPLLDSPPPPLLLSDSGSLTGSLLSSSKPDESAASSSLSSSPPRPLVHSSKPDAAASSSLHSSKQDGAEATFKTLSSLPRSLVRSSPLAIAAIYTVDPAPLDAITANVYSFLLSFSLTFSSMFEAEVASGSFVLWIALFSLLASQLPNITASPSSDPFSWLKKPQEWAMPLFTYLVSIYIFHLFHHHAPVSSEPPTFGRFSMELFAGVFLYDLFFYPLHYLMHKAPLLAKHHGFHHRTGGENGRPVLPVETVQHSFIDGALQVAVNIIVQQISPFGFGGKHLLSKLAHNVVVTYLLVESHSNLDEGWMSHRLWPEFFGGSVQHEVHHRTGKGGYQQFGTWIDELRESILAIGVEKEKTEEIVNP